MIPNTRDHLAELLPAAGKDPDPPAGGEGSYGF